MLKLQSNNNIITTSNRGVLHLRVTKNSSLAMALRHDRALIIDSVTNEDFSGFGMVFTKNIQEKNSEKIHYLEPSLHYLDTDDVIRVIPDKNTVRAIYRVNASANFLFVTEQCNSYCLMCSQPPKVIDDSHLIKELMQAVPLIPRHANEIGITGGEPTLLGDQFINLLKSLNAYLPNTAVHVLTNGRNFSEIKLAEQVSSIRHENLMFGIPLYSDLPYIHDFVVQADGAFDETIRGILNLKRHLQKVEIRVVLHKQTAERLPQLAEFIGRNLQFVDHVALMGLEVTGFTRANLDALWIDPVEYSDKLEEAVSILAKYRIKTSIYNLQRCLLPRELWRISVKSISDWKNKYYDECINCSQLSDCGGFFTSSDIKRSDHIKAI